MILGSFQATATVCCNDILYWRFKGNFVFAHLPVFFGPQTLTRPSGHGPVCKPLGQRCRHGSCSGHCITKKQVYVMSDAWLALFETVKQFSGPSREGLFAGLTLACPSLAPCVSVHGKRCINIVHSAASCANIGHWISHFLMSICTAVHVQAPQQAASQRVHQQHTEPAWGQCCGIKPVESLTPSWQRKDSEHSTNTSDIAASHEGSELRPKRGAHDNLTQKLEMALNIKHRDIYMGLYFLMQIWCLDSNIPLTDSSDFTGTFRGSCSTHLSLLLFI